MQALSRGFWDGRLRNLIVAGNATNRELVWHPITASNFNTTLYVISQFLIPVEDWRKQLYKIPALFIALTALILLVVLVWVSDQGLEIFCRASANASFRDHIIHNRFIYFWIHCFHHRFDAAL